MIDKNLFLHDLAVVAILKSEGPYLKEWLDYHLAAGVDHFYLYDNDSPDNQAEVAKPYVKAGLVDYFPAPGKAMQYVAYNDAIKRFKFQCRYVTFLDGDEFIYPKIDSGGGIVEVVDEILADKPNAAGLEIVWQIFGSNGEEKADYSRGVLERFTRRAVNNEKSNPLCKTIANMRKIDFILTSHCPNYFEGFYAVNSNNEIQRLPGNMRPPIVDKIVVNHYHTKSREEYSTKRGRGIADKIIGDNYSDKQFKDHDCNEEFDDGILHYRDERLKIYQPPDKSHADERLINALTENLSPTLLPSTPPEFFVGKMETFLTCRAVADYLKPRLADDTLPKFFEETAIRAIINSFNGMSFADAQLLIRELPKILSLKYPVVKELRGAVLQIIPQMMNAMRISSRWKDFVELDYLQDILKLGE